MVICIIALSAHAQRCAVLEFKAGVGISQNDVDGISAIFITYFHPAGYTMVERTQIDKVIEEQGFQRSKMTQAQMVRVGEILSVSKIVVGDINVVTGQYNVDARVINVESGTISATEGATFATSSYRTNMQSIATKLASKIAITPGTPVQAAPPSNTTSKRRSEVKVLYGYLKIFPEELGTFQAEPTSVIAQINKQAMHGYNNWRIPNNEELSLMKANNFIGSGEYMTRENRHGIVLLVTDGEDYATIQAEEQERLAEQERKAAELKAEQERKAAEERKVRGPVDLGLPSGTLWATCNVGASKPEEYGDYFAWGETKSKSNYSWSTYKYYKGSSTTMTKYCTSSDYGTVDNKTELEPADDAATANWGTGWQMPSMAQQQELINSNYTTTTWTTQNGVYGRKITSKSNGNSIFLPAAGCRSDTSLYGAGSDGDYWSRSLRAGTSYNGYYLDFISSNVRTYSGNRYCGQSVRPVRVQTR